MRRVPSLPGQVRHPALPGHMVVCGDDALAERLAAELRELYRMRVTVVVPSLPSTADGGVGPDGRARALALLARMQAVVNRAADSESAPDVRVVQAPVLDEEALAEAGVMQADALALVHGDDETNIRAALAAMTVVGRRARGIFAKALDDAAREWNNRVPELVRQDTEQLRLKITESLGAAEAERAAQEAGGKE
ncbi:NAD-binding protein [Streptomyces sp. NBC_00019]|uniref:NAD-binding protein n=1 Tax=Streptomyces sp. NBC_00019 TaxID=2975623 RepID=UPI00324BEE23